MSRALRNWAMSEISIKEMRRAEIIINNSYKEWLKIPSANSLEWTSDLRVAISNWAHIASSYYECEELKDIHKGRQAFSRVHEILSDLQGRLGDKNNYTIDLKGLVYYWQGQQEYLNDFGDT